jgi:exodeoxyribonuclease V gamma subunit
LGNFLEYTTQLFDHVTRLSEKRPLKAWGVTLRNLLERFFQPDQDSEREAQALRRIFRDLEELHKVSGFHEELHVRTIRYYLEQHLKKKGFGFGFMTGGITFCALLPMRSIPFKIIALVGMNGDAYPRQFQPVGFDIISRYPRLGDRSRRNDDRYLFLEALLSARDLFFLSYVGQSTRDNSPIPPSVLVSELLDYIDQGFFMEREEVRDRMVTRHRLQAFNPAYFNGDPRLFSFSRENFLTAQNFFQGQEAPCSVITRGLPTPEEQWRQVNLNDLCRFFSHPVRFLFNGRLGIRLHEESPILEEREPFDLRGIERYGLENWLLEKSLEGRRLEELLPLARASGRLPHGAIGAVLFKEMGRGVWDFMEGTAPYRKEDVLDPLEIDLEISEYRLRGRLSPIYPKHLFQYRYARIRIVDRIRAWIHHLVLNSQQRRGYPGSSLLMGLNPKNREAWITLSYKPVKGSSKILARLLEIYWSGLSLPLHLFPASSWRYAETIGRGDGSDAEALRRARKVWLGSDHAFGEGQDPYYHLCFKEEDPLDSAFQELAQTIFQPIMDHEEEIKT